MFPARPFPSTPGTVVVGFGGAAGPGRPVVDCGWWVSYLFDDRLTALLEGAGEYARGNPDTRLAPSADLWPWLEASVPLRPRWPGDPVRLLTMAGPTRWFAGEHDDRLRDTRGVA